jgi:hypothetical protein
MEVPAMETLILAKVKSPQLAQPIRLVTNHPFNDQLERRVLPAYADDVL